MKAPIRLDTNEDIKGFIIDSLRSHDGTHLDAQEVLDAAYSSKTSISFDSYNEITKEIDLGREIIPRQGAVSVTNNSFWEMQDPGLKSLFPELTDSPDLFEFLITIVYKIKFNKKTDKVEIIQGRYKFSCKMSDFE
jgi:hypothetical protein